MRLTQIGLGRARAEQVTPVAKTGLHCGLRPVAARDYTGSEVTPVAKTGLHCGEDTLVFPKVLQAQVTPVAKTGLHCGIAAAMAAHVILEG